MAPAEPCAKLQVCRPHWHDSVLGKVTVRTLVHSPIQLRAPTADDAPALVPLLAELGYAVSVETLRSNVSRLAAGPTDRVWVACDSDRLLGVVSAHLTPLLHATAHMGRITSLVVHGRARGRCIGRLLMQQAQQYCWAAGCERIELTTSDHRDQAHRFYEGLGFRVESRRFVKHAPSADGSIDPTPPCTPDWSELPNGPTK